MGDLANAVTDLAEAQKELAEAQKRTDSHLSELADAQKGTELAMADLARQVGGLSNALGGSLEDFARDLVPEILEKHWRLDRAAIGPTVRPGKRSPRQGPQWCLPAA